jgi:release factor glutamine methyltransferase
MKPTAWQKRDLTANNTSSTTLLERIRIAIEEQSSSPYLDALVLLTHISGRPKSEILAHPDPELTPEQESQLTSAVGKIIAGIPLPYVLGEWEFFGLRFMITPEVLIPRPESEWLVESAIQWLNENPSYRTCLDLGTGSGCLGISTAYRIPDLMVTAVDISYPALLIARKNACLHQVKDRFRFITSNIFNGFSPQADLIIANLPYIPSEKLKGLAVYQTEPHQALDGGPDGLSYIKSFLEAAPKVINPGGLILLELDEDRGDKALSLGGKSLPNADIQLRQDLSGQDRYLQIRIP